MHRSSSNTRVADDYYRNSSSFFSSSPSSSDGENHSNGGNSNLPMYKPGSHPAKKEKSRLRSAENVVHLIPLVLLLCAVILWFFSNPDTHDHKGGHSQRTDKLVEIVNKNPVSIGAAIEGLHAAGNGIDGTQNTMLPHSELEDHDLPNDNQLQQHQTADKKGSL